MNFITRAGDADSEAWEVYRQLTDGLLIQVFRKPS